MIWICCKACARGERHNAEAPIGTRCRPDCQKPTPAQAHCSCCHHTFGGVSLFDRHRDRGHCVDPATLGMVERGKVWHGVPSESERARLAALRERATP